MTEARTTATGHAPAGMLCGPETAPYVRDVKAEGIAAIRRPRVGVTTSSRRANVMWWLNRLALWRAGAVAVRLSPGATRDLDSLDALVVGGGDDVDARLYGGELSLDIRVDPERDRLELEALEWAERNALPVLGICRGAQMMNVSRGGTLHSDIYEVYVKAPRLRTVLARKSVAITAGSRLHEMLDGLRCRVNSLHHQSVAEPGDRLEVVARDEQGIVQGIEDPSRGFFIGVQWHPELLVLHRHQQRLFRRLVEAARFGADTWHQDGDVQPRG